MINLETMSSTTGKRRPVSVHDYPEHLNPFSECHLNFRVPEYNIPEKRKIIVDKLRKNGTWSSKITKRINRSVSWIEKSWLPTDNSPRRAYESRICNDLHNNALYAKQSEVHNIPVTRRESCSDVRHEVETTPTEFTPSNGNSFEKSKSVENLNKCDTRRRKKRPAPLPPTAIRSSSATERRTVENSDQENKVTNGECELEEKSENEIPIPHREEIATSPTDDKTESSDETLSEEKPQNVPCDKALTKTDESKLTDQIESLQIENDEEEESKENHPTCFERDEDKVEIESDQNLENITQPHLDENANISSAKNENENINEKSNPKVTLLATENEIRNP